MQIVKKLLVVALAVVFMFGLAVQSRAATTPSLGSAVTYGVLGSTYTNTAAGTTITGDVGFTTGPAVAPLGVHTNYGSGAPFSTAGTDQGSAKSSLDSQACTFNFGSATDLSLLAQPLVPGVYCVVGAASIGTGGITLSGAGTYIFRIDGALTSVANSVVTLAGGASACDVFWTPTAATTLGANSTFVGTNIDASGITIGSTVGWAGRALAFGGTVTTNADTITVPSCSVPPPPVAVNGVCGLSNNTTVPSAPTTNLCSAGTAGSVSGSGPWTWVCAGSNGGSTASCSAQLTAVVPPSSATLHVVKQVINNNGGVANASLFNLHVKLAGSDVAGSPAMGAVSPGRSYSLSAGTYVVSEDANTSYTQSFSGACDSNGNVTLVAGADSICTITNDDVAVVAPVVAPVVTPVLPVTGVAPESNVAWKIIIPAGILVALFSFYLARKKQII